MSIGWQSMQLGDFIELKRGYDLPKSKRSAGGRAGEAYGSCFTQGFCR